MEYNKPMSKVWSKIAKYDKYANHIYNLKYINVNNMFIALRIVFGERTTGSRYSDKNY